MRWYRIVGWNNARQVDMHEIIQKNDDSLAWLGFSLFCYLYEAVISMKDIRWVPIYMLCMHVSIHVFRNDPRTSQCTHVTFVSTVYKEHLHLQKNVYLSNIFLLSFYLKQCLVLSYRCFEDNKITTHCAVHPIKQCLLLYSLNRL